MPVTFLQDSNLSMDDLLKGDNLSVADIRQNATITGKIVAFSNEYAILDLGSKSEGRISLREFDEAPNIGDTVEALVRSTDKESGLVNLSKRELEQRRGWEIVKEASENNIPVNGTVKRNMKNGYLVHVEGLPMFLPHSQVGNLGNARRGQKSSIVGSTMSFRILELNPRKRTGVLSRKIFQDEQSEAAWKELGSQVQIGDIIKGTVVSHSKAGAFINIHGIEGFLHRSNISWDRKTDNFKDKLPVGSEIQVRVLEIIPEDHRLSLGLKQLTEDPWTTVMSRYNVGDVVKGRVSFVANYGAFIDLGDGLEGLLHISEMSWTRKVNHAQEVLKLDQEVEAKILAINPADKRISLGLRQLTTNPWDTLKEAVKIGQVMKSKVKDITNFGIFVSITDEIDGLVRKEDVRWEDTNPDLKKLYKAGDEVEFKIIDINYDTRKIECSIRHCLPNPYRKLRDKFPRGTVVEGEISGVVDFGIFVKFDEGYEGLVHLSAMDKEQAASPKKAFKKGDPIKVVIRSIDPDNRKISLSLKDVEYALERIEMQQYLEKDNRPSQESHSPFANLRKIVS